MAPILYIERPFNIILLSKQLENGLKSTGNYWFLTRLALNLKYKIFWKTFLEVYLFQM